MKKDIVIIGGGPAGLSFALSLAATNLQITILEKQPLESLANPAYDGREIAITHFSRKFLEEHDVWQHIPVEEISMIKEAKIFDGNSSYFLHFDHSKVYNDSLGLIISNHLIRKALYEEVKSKSNIEIIPNTSVRTTASNDKYVLVTLDNKETMEVPLLVAADSRFSESRRSMGISASMYDFGRVMIVFRMEHENPHNNIAYECFHYEETLAVLPLSANTSSIVLTVKASDSAKILNMNEIECNRYIRDVFNNRFGSMQLISKRYCYPLIAVYANKFFANRFALVGDAAVGMHPVTAHGFNLGLKGVTALSQQIKAALARNMDVGSSQILARYQINHNHTCKPIYIATNAIAKLYNDTSTIAKFTRKVVLRLGEKLTPIKCRIMKQLVRV